MSYLGIDLGARRVGIALSESGVMATPHSVLRNEGDLVEKVARLVTETGAETIVIGLPRRALSSSGEEKYRQFAAEVGQRTCKTVVLWDESLTTVEAGENLRAAGRSRREAQKDIDMYAAAVILQSYLDDHNVASASGRTP